MMSYRQVKWLILIIPTLTIALWEYVRHEYLLPYISMDLGNWLSPVIIFLVTMTLLRKLFIHLEHMQEQLQRERAAKAILEERELMARELHDGVAQTLFLLSVKIDRLQKENKDPVKADVYVALKKTVHEINEYVRQAITSLRYAPTPDELPWRESIQRLVEHFREETGVTVYEHWSLSDHRLSYKERVELYAFIREAFLNIRKHAEARHAWLHLVETDHGFSCTIEDDGKGFPSDEPIGTAQGKFGLQIMKERAAKMNWHLNIARKDGKTILHLSTEEG